MTVWISVAEAAARLCVTRMTVYNWLTKKQLKGKKLQPLGFWVVSATSVDRLAKERADAR